MTERRRIDKHPQHQRHLANDLFLTIRRAERTSWPMQTSGTGWLGFKTLGGYARGVEPDSEFIKGLSLSEAKIGCPPHAFFMFKDHYLDFLSLLGYDERAVWDDLMFHRATRAIWHLNKQSEARGAESFYSRNPEVDERTASLSLELLTYAETVQISSAAAKEILAARQTADEMVEQALTAAKT